MPATFVETFDSQEGNVQPNSDYVLKWVSFYEEDLGTVLTDFASVVPATFQGLPLITIHPKHLGAGVYELTAFYKYDYEPTFSFDTTGGTAHITQAKATISSYPAPGFGTPSFGGAIGVTKDSIEGTDVIVPIYKSVEQYFFDNSVIDGAYKLTVFSLTGKVNNATFKGFASGECLFEGARGTRKGTGKWDISYHFAGSPNVTGLTVGTIAGIAKHGWNYLWFRYADFDSSGQLSRKLTCAIVDRVYDTADFSLLGIGT